MHKIHPCVFQSHIEVPPGCSANIRYPVRGDQIVNDICRCNQCRRHQSFNIRWSLGTTEEGLVDAHTTHLDDQVADGRNHHQLPTLANLRATGHPSFEKGLLEREARGELAPPGRTRRAFVHGQTRLLVDIYTATPRCKEPGRCGKFRV